jgi:signal transduction histidine kinase
VECQGIVREAKTNSELSLVTRSGKIPIRISESEGGSYEHLVDALVKIRAVLVYQDDKATLFLPSLAFLEVVESAPKDAFSAPVIAIDKLGGFARHPATSHRGRIKGVVTCVGDTLLVVQDGSGGVLVKTHEGSDFNLADEVEVVGFPEMESGTMALDQALVRKTGQAALPEPRSVTSEELYSGKHGAQVIQLAGELLGQKYSEGVHILELQSGDRFIRAELPGKAGMLAQIPVGSRLQVTGVSLLARPVFSSLVGESSEPQTVSYGILMRNPWDVVVLQRPPWWALRHAALIIGALAVVLAVAAVWIRYLRRKVARRTRQLQEAMNKLEKETRVSATLAERDRLAGEIHDSIEQGLSAIVIQIESALKHFGTPEKARRHMDMAKSMAVYSRSEVQNAVWDIQSPMLENVDLAGALRRISQSIGSGDRPQVTVAIEGTIVPLGSTAEHHLLRIAQEAITNAVKHANPENILIKLQYQDDRVILRIRDDGAGFVPGTISTSVGHFGLQGMQVRAQKIGATVSVESKVGEGTCIEIVIPCEKKPASPAATL